MAQVSALTPEQKERLHALGIAPRVRSEVSPLASPSGPIPEDLLPFAMQAAEPRLRALEPPLERNIAGEAIAGTLRGGFIRAPQTVGKAAEALGLETVGRAIGGLGTAIEESGYFAPSVAAEQPGARRIVASAFESIGQTTAITATVGLPALVASVATGAALPAVLAFTAVTPLVFGAAEYQQFGEEMKALGIPDDWVPKLLSALAEFGGEAAGNTLELLALRSGFAKGAIAQLKQPLRDAIKRMAGPQLRKTAQRMALTASTEAISEGLTAEAQTTLRQGAGIPVEGQTGEAVLVGGLAGLVFGALGGGAAHVRKAVRASGLRQIADANAPVEARTSALNRIMEAMETAPEGAIDQDIPPLFRQYAKAAIAGKQAIPLEQPVPKLIAGMPRPTEAAPQFPPRTTQFPEPGAEEIQVTGQPPIVPRTTTGAEAERVRAAELATQGSVLVEGPDGLLGEIRYSPTGQLEFVQPARRPLAGETPQVADDAEFQALFAPTGIAPDRVNQLRQRFFARELPAIAPDVSPAAEPVTPAGVGATTTAQEVPLPQRLQEAQETALQFVIAQQAQGFPGFSFAEAAEGLATAHTIPRADAQRILSEALAAAKPPEARRPAPPLTPQAAAIAHAVTPAPPTLGQETKTPGVQTPHDRAVLNAIGSTQGTTYVVAKGQRLRVHSSNYGLIGRAIGAEIQLMDGSGIDTVLIDRVEDAQGRVLYERPATAAPPAPEAAEVPTPEPLPETESVAGSPPEIVSSQPSLPPRPALPHALGFAEDVFEAPLEQLHLDPERYQYKIIHGATGETGSLAGAKRFNRAQADVLDVWWNPGTQQIDVVNGHNRVGLAQRSGVPSMAVRFIEAATPERARAVGALRNIGQGQGTAVDAAKFFRDSGATAESLADLDLPMTAAKIQDGLALANLNPTLFGAVVMGQFPMERAVIIGRVLAEPAQQFALMREMDHALRRRKNLTNAMIQEMAETIRDTPMRTVEEETLFGPETRTVSLAPERAELSAHIRRQLSTDKVLFGKVAKTKAAENLARAGNVIDIQRSQAISKEAAQLLDIFDQLKNRAGAISDALNAGAERLGRGESLAAVERDTFARIRQDLPGIIGRGLEERRAGGQPTLGLGPSLEGAPPTPSPEGTSTEAPAGLPGTTQPELGQPQQFAIARPGPGSPESGRSGNRQNRLSADPLREMQPSPEELTRLEEIRRQSESLLGVGEPPYTNTELAQILEGWRRFPSGQRSQAAPLQPVTKANLDDFILRQIEGTQEQNRDLTDTERREIAVRLAAGESRMDILREYRAKLRDITPQMFGAATRRSLADLTLADVQAAFPGQTVTALPNGAYRVSLPRGRHVDIHQVERITMGQEERMAFEIGYQQPFSAERMIAGRIWRERIELVRGVADRVTLRHEVLHFLENSGLLTRAEVRSLNQAAARALRVETTTTEQRVQWVAEQLDAREYQQDSPLGRILDKVWDFFDKLLGLVGIQTTRGVLRQIETGAVFGRDGAAAATPTQQFATQPGTSTPPPRPRTGEPLPREGKPFAEYLSFVHQTTPLTQIILGETLFQKVRLTHARLAQDVAAIRTRWEEHEKELPQMLERIATGKHVLLTTEQQALRSLLLDMGEAVETHLRQGTITREDAVDFTWKALVPLSELSVGQGSESARSTYYLREVPFMQGYLTRLSALAKRTKLSREELLAWDQKFREVDARGDPAEIDNFLASIKEPALWDYLRELRYGSMMSGFSTQVVNTTGNVFWQFFSQVVLRGMEGALSQFVLKNQAPDMQRRYVSEVWPALLGYTRGFRRERLRILPTFIRGGHAAVAELPGLKGLPFMSKFERDVGQHREAWKNATWRLDFTYAQKLGYSQEQLREMFAKAGRLIGADVRPGQPIAFMRRIAPAVTLAMRAMTAMDILTGYAAYDSEAAALVERQVRNEEAQGGLQGLSHSERVTQLMTQLPQEIHDSALTRSQALTFMDQVGPVGHWIMQGRNMPGIGIPLQILFPFVATPDRLITRALEMVPGLGAVMLRRAGTPTAELLAKQIAGMVIMSAMFALWEAGDITGAPPPDATEREAFYRQGRQPYSLRIPGTDTWINYRRWEPMNLVFAGVPIIGDAIVRARARDDELGVLSVMTLSGMHMAHHILDSSFFSGIEPLFRGVTRGVQAESFLGRLVDGFVPFSGLRRNMQRAVDAYITGQGSIVRDPKSFLTQISGVGALLGVQPKFNVWGEPIIIPGNVFSQFIPYRISSLTTDPVERELGRLEIFPGPPSQTQEGRKLTQAQYDVLVQQSGQQAKRALDQLLAGPSYWRMSNELRERVLKRTIQSARRDARETFERQTGTARRLPVALAGGR